MTTYRPRSDLPQAYGQGQVVLVPFPFTDQDTRKKRPAVVVSRSWYNHRGPDYILVAITSTIRPELDRDEVIIRGAEVTGAGLLNDSVVRAGKVFTIDRTRIVKPLGRLSQATLMRVLERLDDVLFEARSSAMTPSNRS
jgi:mRNA interferase MazF